MISTEQLVTQILSSALFSELMGIFSTQDFTHTNTNQ